MTPRLWRQALAGRDTRRAVTVAVIVWVVFAAVVWNVIFDQLLIIAGRRYSYDAVVFYQTTHHYLRIDDVMRPAIAHAVRVSSLWSGALLAAGLVAVRFAVRGRGRTVRRVG